MCSRWARRCSSKCDRSVSSNRSAPTEAATTATKKLEMVALIQLAQVRREDAAIAQRQRAGEQLLAPCPRHNHDVLF